MQGWISEFSGPDSGSANFCGGKMFYFRRTTVFSGTPLLKARMTRCVKIWGDISFWDISGYAYGPDANSKKGAPKLHNEVVEGHPLAHLHIIFTLF